jgi:polyhydroxyalkanoate synthesis regulator phasin
MQDNAERVAALARERFGKNVYTIPDRLSDLYKVMVGDFTVKDEARRFRDEMVQRFPSDYKDAWVSELPAK